MKQWVLWKLILLSWLFLISVKQKYKTTARLQKGGSNSEQFFVKLNEIKMFLLSIIGLVAIGSLFFRPMFL
jgi:hypothetical protein